jgi:NADH-quinone oxidoreductase subunit L
MMEANELAILIPVLPILAMPVILFLGQLFNGNAKWKGFWKEGGTISTAVLAIVFLLSLWLIVGHVSAFSEGSGDDVVTDVGNWVSYQLFTEHGDMKVQELGFGMQLDHVSVMLLFVASFLCLLISIFSMGYMNTDEVNENRNHRFYGEFVLFCAGMFGMVLADNFLWLFIFWEIMGLCSYLLIGFYYERPSASYAAKKAFLTTRVGDVFLFVGLLIMHAEFGSWDFAVVFNAANIGAADAGLIKAMLLLMFIGAVGKSAQFPLHVWLPDAMEGPTPVSALIHAATMVNAGLYLVARMFPFFAAPAMAGELGDVALLIAMIGGITAFMAAAIAFVQKDIKKVLAYSTMSQLAYIFTGLGAALWFVNNGHDELAFFAFGASMFHLFNHAMAKGMLFMASGSVIHEMHHAHHHLEQSKDGHDEDDDHHFDAQDMDNMGGLASRMPITAIAMAAGSASIIGIPLIGGFWSKEGIVGSAWKAVMYDGGGLFIIPAILVLLTAGMTGFYMSRMWFMTFAGKPKTEVAAHVEETTPFIPIPLVTLTIMTLGGILFAGLNFAGWLGENSTYLSLSHAPSHLWHEITHAFLALGSDGHMDPFILIITWTTILLSMVIGPFYAMSLYGGKLAKGQKAHWSIAWIIALSGRIHSTYKFDNSIWAESGLSTALRNRLYFDQWYDSLMLKIVVPFSYAAAWFDRKIIDGVIKGIETGSQEASRNIRSLTTGSARDYIMMAALGTLAIFLLIWGVA